MTRLEGISKELLSDRPDLTDKMKDEGWNLLHCACFAGREDVVAQILCVAPDMVDEFPTTDPGLTPLMIAFNEEHESVMLQILKACPKQASTESDDGGNVLHWAAEGGFRKVVEHLLTTNPDMVNAVTDDGDTPLHVSAAQGDITVFSLLLAANPALITATGNDDFTVLHFAAKNGHASLVEFLLTKSATLLNAVTVDNMTAMHRAAEAGHLSVVKVLLAASPELIHMNATGGWNAVHFALSEGHTAVALYLLTEVPALISTANDRLTPLHFAAENGLTEVVAHILGVDATLSNARTTDYGWTPFHSAAYNDHVAVAEQLLAANPALIDMTTPNDGFTPLHCAASKGHSAMVSYLLSLKPAVIDALAISGITVLHLAVVDGQAVVKQLLAVKPELVSLKDDEGNTPLHFLVEKCQSRELIEHVWRLYPEALHAVNKDKQTPLHKAVANRNDCAIELFQWGLTWFEIRRTHRHCRKSCQKFKPLMKAQCEQLSELLLPDVVAIVFDYLGFKRDEPDLEKPAKKPRTREPPCLLQ